MTLYPTKYFTTADVIVGVLFFVTVIVIMLMYTACLIVIWSNKNLMKSWSYQIMFQLGIIEHIGLIFFLFIAGISNSNGPVWAVAPLVALSGFQCVTAQSFTTLLAFDRFLAITSTSPFYVENLFGKYGKKIFTAVPYTFGLLSLILCAAIQGNTYSLWSYTWFYDFTKKDVTGLIWVQFSISTFNTIGMVIFYAFMLWKMFKKASPRWRGRGGHRGRDGRGRRGHRDGGGKPRKQNRPRKESQGRYYEEYEDRRDDYREKYRNQHGNLENLQDGRQNGRR